ncbi:hypothetical protein D9615_010175 [Tricholomella constricta]|uniref:Endoplasmic reticulum junction formation protein lunapark n=1 Tax=Tricholomella constricta TaxID=117010 RepID=A0A8H5GR17_9AGAR|nr:hypothetical protein D9615_010175 [Tricholomella constricta]
MQRMLLKEQRKKVEEIKKKTNFYSTRDLLQRYDESATPGLRQRLVPAPTQPSTPQRPPPPPNGNTLLQTPNPFSPQPSTPLPSMPPRKQWYDKLADALLGDDDHTPNASTSRYALICEKCFAHNGLVKESMWADAQYVCPKCNHFNPSANSKKQARTSPSPSSISPKPVSPPLPHNGRTPERESQPSTNGSPPAVEAAAAAEASMMEIDDS